MVGQLYDLERRGLGNTPEAQALRAQLKDRLRELADFMKKILTDRVVDDFADITTPLKVRKEKKKKHGKEFEMKIIAIRRSSPCRPLHAQQGAELRREGQQADRSLAIDDADCSIGMMRIVLRRYRVNF